MIEHPSGSGAPRPETPPNGTPHPEVAPSAPAPADAGAPASELRILCIDVGGTNVKVKCSTGPEVRKAASGPGLTANRMVDLVKTMTRDWEFDAIAMGFPGPVVHGRIAREPFNLGGGWMAIDFAERFGKPIKIVNDAAMQAIGGYRGGRMLFLGLGTGFGSAMIVNGIVQPMELGHLPRRKRRTYEDFAGKLAQARLGRRRWRKAVREIIGDLAFALQADYVLVGGGEADKLKRLPANCIFGSNADAFAGGIRLWTDQTVTV